MKALILFFIRLYRRYISPLCPPACRFVPTCSEYAIEAFETKGTLTAMGMTAARIMKCHPFHPGGYDPVNPVGDHRESKNGADSASSSTASRSKAQQRP